MNSGTFKRNPRAGQTLATVALALVVLLGLAGIAIDVGMMMLARNEVQNAADAAALTGVAELYKGNAPPPAGSAAVTPNWTRAQDSAAKAVTRNKVMNTALVTGTYQTGYWNITGTPAGMQSKTKSPLLATDRPAIKVSIVKSAGSNGGPISFFLAPLVGVSNINIKASAVAVVSYPGAVEEGELMPVAITKCLYDTYWDVATNSPKIDPGTGLPYEFTIKSSYKTNGGPCFGGQWTSFQTGDNNVPTIRGFIANGNPTRLGIGDSIYIEPGVKNTLFDELPQPSDVFFPVVLDVSDVKSWQVIAGFAPFHITSSIGKSQKEIKGHFNSGKILPFSTTGGPSYGAVSPPVLVQ